MGKLNLKLNPFPIFFMGMLLLGIHVRGQINTEARSFNGKYFGEYLNRIAFPIGGIGAGIICVEGTGAVSNVSVRNHPDIYNEPYMYSALCIKNEAGNIAKVIEGPVPKWKRYGEKPGCATGLAKTSYGFPRFDSNTFLARFPFAEIEFNDNRIPLEVSLKSWSPFIPGDADNTSLPVGAFEYHFVNPTDETIESVFSFNSENFMSIGDQGSSIKKFPNGFLLWQDGNEVNPNHKGGMAFFVDEENVKVNCSWFRGMQFDTKTITWNQIQNADTEPRSPIDEGAPGASLYVPFTLKPGEQKTIILKFCWYVPDTDLRKGRGSYNGDETYRPWYSGKFADIYELAKYWQSNYDDLRNRTKLFSDALYESTLPDEVLEAVAANLSILKSPTVLRQTDGRFWAWEGCDDEQGIGAGTCTHVWNYAQALPHLFPELERSIRETEFDENQTEDGFQKFRALLPIRETDIRGSGMSGHAAADGQLGGIMKVYREWRISGDTEWLKSLWPNIKQSMAFCIGAWDPKHKGVIEEPHHNTYDIEFWGPTGMCTSFYLGALTSMIKMGEVLGDNVDLYKELLEKGKSYMESELYNGEYFVQKVQWEGLETGNPIELANEAGAWNIDYSPEAIELFKKEGPKYQYGSGCLSDGILGLWIARVCGIDNDIIDNEKVKNHLRSIYRYNLRRDLTEHVNPQRPGYAMGEEGGLLLCTWPKGGKPTLPFVYSDEVWTGIEYQVASHLIMEGMVDEGLEIIRICRERYDGRIRNPFAEYEFGRWYARAMASYSLLQALTGIRYDAIEKSLYIDSRIGNDFSCFISTETGFGLTGLKNGSPFLDVRFGEIKLDRCLVAGVEVKIHND